MTDIWHQFQEMSGPNIIMICFHTKCFFNFIKGSDTGLLDIKAQCDKYI